MYVDPNKDQLPLTEDGSVIDHSRFHSADKFVIHRCHVEHQTFGELHHKVFRGCPPDYICVEPIALHHEVLWTMGFVPSVGVNGNRFVERDQLRHAVEEQEYESLPWNEINSFCVDVVRRKPSD